jgi:hypothetical protein
MKIQTFGRKQWVYNFECTDYMICKNILWTPFRCILCIRQKVLDIRFYEFQFCCPEKEEKHLKKRKYQLLLSSLLKAAGLQKIHDN